MRREKPPPVAVKMLDAQGNLDPHWLRWFQRVGTFGDDFRKTPDLVFTTDASLTTDDFGKIIAFNNGAADLTCNLMTITKRDLYCWIGPIYRLGTGRVTITADSLSSIEYSSPGGSLSCDEERRAAANVTLEVIALNKWAIIGGTGLWLSD